MRSRSLTLLFGVAAVCFAAVACSKDNSGSTPTSPACTVTASAASSSFAAAGGTGSVTVTAAAGCAWTATTSASFVTITSGASGSGNGTVSYTVSANTGAARTGTLTVGGTSFTISQSAASTPPPPPTGTLGAPTANSPVGGATVTSGNPTLVVNNATATGNVGTVTYRFEVSDQPTFPSDPVRTFTVDGIPQGDGATSWTVTRTLGNDVLWYWHARATNGTTTSDYSPTETFRTASSCTVSVPTTVSVAATASATNLAVTTSTATCGWTAQSNAPWITVTSGASGTGSGLIGISIAANTSGAARTGTITVNNQTVTVNQATGSPIVASFRMRQPARSGSAAVTDCLIEPGTGLSGSTCILDSTSFPTGTNGLVKFDWNVTFFDGATQTFTQSGANTSLSFTWTCGGPSSANPPGATQPLSVTLTVTDSAGNTATATSGSGSQPALTITLNKC
jgi:all-beta uncharacterized protein